MNHWVKNTIIDVLCGISSNSLLRMNMKQYNTLKQAVQETLNVMMNTIDYNMMYNEYLNGAVEKENIFFEYCCDSIGLRCLTTIHDDRKEQYEKTFNDVFCSKKGVESRFCSWTMNTIYNILFYDNKKIIDMMEEGCDLFECVNILSSDIFNDEMFKEYFSKELSYDSVNILFNIVCDHFALMCFDEYPIFALDIVERGFMSVITKIKYENNNII